MRRNTYRRVALVWMVCLTVSGCAELLPKEPLPVAVTFRKAILDESAVAQFRNDTDRYLRIQVRIEPVNDQEDHVIQVVLQPYETTEIGWLEGWKFSAGERLILSHDSYATVRYHVPKHYAVIK